MTAQLRSFSFVSLLSLLGLGFVAWGGARADGGVRAPRGYFGSLEERAQQAIIILQKSPDKGGASEDLILNIRVQGRADHFAWLIPFPHEPATKRESPLLFQELYSYVEARRIQLVPKHANAPVKPERTPESRDVAVEVLSRETVGSYDVAVVREHEAGALNRWLQEEGFQSYPDAEEVIAFYRQKGYVFACIKVSAAELSKRGVADLHPLRFTFPTGGRDGIYFPMKMTGLQTEPFDVNLYVFCASWLNDQVSRYGYAHRGFRLRYRDWDTAECVPNAGKSYSAPQTDPFLRDLASHLPTVTKLLQKLHPGDKYYLTNIQTYGLHPADVRDWSDDLWLFPYYSDSQFVPYDARPGGPAATAGVSAADPEPLAEVEEGEASDASLSQGTKALWFWPTIIALTVLAVTAFALWARRKVNRVAPLT